MIGEKVSHYKILEELGQGGMGVVYKAEDTKLERTVALKFLPAGLTRDVQAKKRFVQEAQAASALDHPNVCTIHEIDETSDGRMFICMACYEGETLKEKIARGPLDIEEARGITSQVAEGLSKAHNSGIIHRDIKPANVFVTKDDRVKIVDFGLAKLTGQMGITKTGTTVGTVAYMSPEQGRGDDVDQRTDVWSLGVVLFEMITGELPFRGDYDQALMYSIVNDAPKEMTSLRPDVPPAIVKIVGKALAKAPDERYENAEALLVDLKSTAGSFVPSAVEKRNDDAQTVPSIAVLPFVNMSPDPENAYFGDGLAEELINALAQLEGLRVAARTSAFRFRGRDVDIREIGKKLDVNTVLEGSVRKAGNRLRITAQLINIEDGYHLWSQRYDREMEDIFAIQDEIARAIVKQLEVKLVRGVSEPLVRQHTDNLEAYTLYLKAQHILFTLTPEGWQQAFELYKKAVDLDPSFALPFVSLSQIYQSQCFWADASPDDAMPQSRAAVEKALELDDDLAIAHNVLAVIHWSYDWDWEAAEREFRRAFELDPRGAFNYINHSLFLAAQGRHDEAVAEARLGRKLDPLSSVIAAWESIPLTAAGLYDESIEGLQRAISMDPTHWQPYLHLGSAYLFVSKIDEAAAACEKAVGLSGGASVALSQLCATYYLARRNADGDKLLEKLIEKNKETYVAPYLFGRIHTVRGDEAETLKHMDAAIRARDPWLVLNKLFPTQIRPSGPAIDMLLSRVGL